MTAIDHETNEDIINPGIVVSNIRTGTGVYINTQTFRQCQDELVTPIDWNKGADLDGFYKVGAIVFEYNDWPLKSVSIVREPRAKVMLGYLPKETAKKYLPKTHEFLSREGRQQNSNLEKAATSS